MINDFWNSKTSKKAILTEEAMNDLFQTIWRNSVDVNFKEHGIFNKQPKKKELV